MLSDLEVILKNMNKVKEIKLLSKYLQSTKHIWTSVRTKNPKEYIL